MGRPKGRPRKVIPEQDLPETPLPQEDQIADLNKKFDLLVDIVGTLAKQTSSKEEVNTVQEKHSAEGRPSETTDISHKFPKEWRDKVDTILGKDFDLRIEDTANGDFMAFIYVPEYLDRRPAKDDQIIARDISTGLMRRSSPAADLENWCQKVKKTIQALYPNYQS